MLFGLNQYYDNQYYEAYTTKYKLIILCFLSNIFTFLMGGFIGTSFFSDNNYQNTTNCTDSLIL